MFHHVTFGWSCKLFAFIFLSIDLLLLYTLNWRDLLGIAPTPSEFVVTPLRRSRDAVKKIWSSVAFTVEQEEIQGFRIHDSFSMILTDEAGKCLFHQSGEVDKTKSEREKCSWAASQRMYKDWFFVHNSVAASCKIEDVQNSGHFIFLGGHFGASCLRVRAAGCRVTCVEPVMEMTDTMEKSVLVNSWDLDGFFHIIPNAVGEKSMKSATTNAFRRESKILATQTVPMVAIKDIVPKNNEDVETIVIDIDGHDGGVIRALIALLESGQKINNIVLESWNIQWYKWDNISRTEGEALVDRLYEFGYIVFYSPRKHACNDFEFINALEEQGKAALTRNLMFQSGSPVYQIPRETMRVLLYGDPSVKHFWFATNPQYSDSPLNPFRFQ